jgi:hypothetical protein
MNRRERLLATLRGQPVDRPAVSFYEINGLEEGSDQDPYNIYAHPSWVPLIALAADKTDRIVMRTVPLKDAPPNPLDECTQVESWTDAQGSLYTRRAVRAGRRTLTSLTRRDRDVNTVWTVEHLLKHVDDLRAYLELPTPEAGGEPDVAEVLRIEQLLGDTGIVMIDTGDPLCAAASLFDLGAYTVLATSEPHLFRRLLDRFAAWLWPKTEAVARALPGRLWRIYGPEYASPPYLRPSLFHEYVVAYDKPMVQAIQRYGGLARLHSHGNLRAILDAIASTGCDGLDPIEPPPQGDVSLAYVRERYGHQMVLFGNLEISDIEGLPTAAFEERVWTALREGTAGDGRGFVLMPSACPYGRILPAQTLANYRKIIEVVERFAAGERR